MEENNPIINKFGTQRCLYQTPEIVYKCSKNRYEDAHIKYTENIIKF